MACDTAWWGLCKEKPCGWVQNKAGHAERQGVMGTPCLELLYHCPRSPAQK